MLYQNFIQRIEEKTKNGKRLKEAIESGDDVSALNISALIAAEDASAAAGDAVKARQLYTRYDDVSKRPCAKKPQNVTVMVPVHKRSLLGPAKLRGTISVSSPMTDYLINYMQRERFRSDIAANEELWKLEIPINVTFLPEVTGAGKVPEIVGVTT